MENFSSVVPYKKITNEIKQEMTFIEVEKKKEMTAIWHFYSAKKLKLNSFKVLIEEVVKTKNWPVSKDSYAIKKKSLKRPYVLALFQLS